MKFSKLTDYAVVILTALAKSKEGSYSASQIAKLSNVPEPTVSKVLKMLSRKGLVQAQRGAYGGYSLASEVEDISVLDVLTAIEGPLTMTECASNGEEISCSMEAICALSGRWGIVNKAIEETLQGISLAKIISPKDRIELLKEEGQKAYV
jgi:FeS assembly SUF system regulator